MFEDRTSRCLFCKVILFSCQENSKCKVANGKSSNGLNLFSRIRKIRFGAPLLLPQVVFISSKVNLSEVFLGKAQPRLGILLATALLTRCYQFTNKKLSRENFAIRNYRKGRISTAKKFAGSCLKHFVLQITLGLYHDPNGRGMSQSTHQTLVAMK